MVYVVLMVLLLLTGLLTLAEMALFSVRRERLELAANNGDNRGKTALAYLDDPPKFLTSSNVLLTLLSVLTGSLVQPFLTAPLSGPLVSVGVPTSLVASASYATAVTLLTIVSLVASNLLPKHLGFVWAEPVSIVLAPFMRVYVALAQPLSLIVEPIVRLCARLLGVPQSAQAKVGEGDLLLLLEEGLRCGGVDAREQEIAKRAFALSDRRVEECMSPREAIEWLDIEQTPSVFREKVAKSDRSWFLVADGSLDKVVGVLQARRYLSSSSPPDRSSLLAMLTPPLSVPIGTRLLTVLEKIKDSESRLVIVVTPEKSVAGLVTVHDVLSDLVGPIRSLK